MRPSRVVCQSASVTNTLGAAELPRTGAAQQALARGLTRIYASVWVCRCLQVLEELRRERG